MLPISKPLTKGRHFGANFTKKINEIQRKLIKTRSFGEF